MFELYITDRHNCNGDFLTRIAYLASLRPHGIILREKDLQEDEYLELAKKVLPLCRTHDAHCILHSFVNVARRLECHSIHLPMESLRRLSCEERGFFSTLGASCHSVEEAIEAENLGCTYVTAGHVFPTKCKDGVPPRGLDFLRNVCHAVRIPVYALGGMTEENRPLALSAGAAGVAVMSLGMTIPF